MIRQRYAVRFLEELSINAWPAAQTLAFDGWLLRFADGYTKRANSINPLYPSSLPLDEKIARCEDLYTAQSLRTVYKLTRAVFPTRLDSLLAERGYLLDSPTRVQTLRLAKALHPAQATLSPAERSLSTQLTEEWFEAFCSLSDIKPAYQSSLRAILTRIQPATGFLLLKHQGQPAACGMGVIQSGFLGLFDIVTHPQLRRQGFGRETVYSLLAWGQENGAANAYLQVIAANTPAINLYQRIGFQDAYQYWYRMKPALSGGS